MGPVDRDGMVGAAGQLDPVDFVWDLLLHAGSMGSEYRFI